MMKSLSLPVGGRLPACKKRWDPPTWMYPIIYNKWKIVTIVLVAVLIFSLFGLGFADGTAYDDKGLGFGLDGMIKDIFASQADLIDWVLITKNLKLQALEGTANDVDVLGAYIGPIYNVFSSLGMVFMLMFWGIGFFEMLMQNNNQLFLEQVVKKLIMLIIGILIISNAKEIVIFCMSLSKGIWDAVGSLQLNDGGGDYVIANDVAQRIYDEVKNQGPLSAGFTKLGYVLQLVAPWLMGLIAYWGVKLNSLNRYLEVCIITATSPLLFCDVSSSGSFTHSAAFRGMRHVLALAMQGIVILAGLYLCGAVSSAIISGYAWEDFFNTACSLIMIAMAKMGIATKSQQIARQLVGL